MLSSNQKEYTFLALGDSYTIGESVLEQERWPNQMVKQLLQTGINVKEPKIIATTGWTTSELRLAIIKADLKEDFDYVSLLIGVNNQYRGESTQQYKIEFQKLLTTSVKLARGKQNHVFVISIPDYAVTPFAKKLDRAKTAKEIDEFNAINYLEAKKQKVNYIEITQASRMAATDLDLIARDGLHPSAKMYKEWAFLISQQVAKIISKK